MLEKLFRRTQEKFTFQPFESQFENGVRFMVSQLHGDEIEIKLTRNGEDIYNFKNPDCVSPGTKFIFNPSARWSVDIDLNGKGDSLVNCENFRGIEDISLSFLHEVGHLNHLEETRASAATWKEFERRKNGRPPLTPDEMRKMHEILLRAEQLAYEWAIQKTKEIEQKFGITILSKIGTKEDVQKKIEQEIATYMQPFLKEMPKAVHLAMRRRREK